MLSGDINKTVRKKVQMSFLCVKHNVHDTNDVYTHCYTEYLW